MYKNKKHFSAKLWFPYYYATITNRKCDAPQLASIKLGCNRLTSHSSEHTFTDGTIQTTKVNAILVRPSKIVYDNTNINSIVDTSLKSRNKVFICTNHLMDASKNKIVTDLKVECNSHVDSELLKPEIYLEKSASSSKDYKTTVDAYRSNPGGFVGFNFAVAKSSVTQFKDLKGKHHLFPEETYRHSEETYEGNNLNIKVEKNHDLIFIPNFDWFKAINATYILANGKQAMTVSKPYYECNVIGTYFEM